MTVLYTNIGLSRRTGTEVLIADLAKAVKAQGHQPIVYSPSLGPIADEIRAAGIPVETDLQRLPVSPDVIHGHHHLETIQAIQRFPQTPALFVCHDVNAWHDQVPRHPHIRRFVAVGLNARRRLLHDWVGTSGRIEVIGNGVDVARFQPRSALPPTPRRALVFSNDAGDGSHWEPIAKACAIAGISVDRVGSAAGRQVAAPEGILGDYDLVLAKGRCALEAAAVGAAVILCDIHGLGWMITSRTVPRLYAWNFGVRTHPRPVRVDSILAEIRRYDPRDAEGVRDFIRSHATLSQVIERYLAIYRQIRAEGVPEARPDYGPVLYPQTRRLERSHQAGLKIEIQDCPQQARAGSWIALRVKLKSRIDTPVATSPPNPTLLFHRWYEANSDTPLAVETRRGIVQPPLNPGKARQFTVRLVAPRKAGRFRLRMTLLQEGWRWLDELEPRVFADRWITVLPDPPPAGQAVPRP
jgi:glycosyltransferase involved in cell wall biosynthesis